MKLARGIVVVLMFLLYVPATGQTAWEYYKEPVKADGLERMSNMYVCFRDDTSSPAFFTFSKSEDIARLFPWEEAFGKEKGKKYRAEMQKPSLVVVNYYKGVNQDPYFLDKDGESWVGDMEVEGGSIRTVFTVNWKTLRYRYSVETKTAKSRYWKPAGDHYGQCINRTADPGK